MNNQMIVEKLNELIPPNKRENYAFIVHDNDQIVDNFYNAKNYIQILQLLYPKFMNANSKYFDKIKNKILHTQDTGTLINSDANIFYILCHPLQMKLKCKIIIQDQHKQNHPATNGDFQLKKKIFIIDAVEQSLSNQHVLLLELIKDLFTNDLNVLAIQNLQIYFLVGDNYYITSGLSDNTVQHTTNLYILSLQYLLIIYSNDKLKQILYSIKMKHKVKRPHSNYLQQQHVLEPFELLLTLTPDQKT